MTNILDKYIISIKLFDVKFLKYFPKNINGMYIIYELYTFDNFFRLLLKNNFSHIEAINFVISECSISGLVFQERIHNKQFLKLLAKNALAPKEAAIKARLLYDVAGFCNYKKKNCRSLSKDI